MASLNKYCLFVFMLVFSLASTRDLPFAEGETRLPVVGVGRLASLAPREPRLPLPSAQDLEAIKKVAQILVTIGEQVIPAILGDTSPPPTACTTAPTVDVPNDPVYEKGE